MAESIVQVTEGSGKKLHTWNRTIGANSVEDEAIYLSEQPLASYRVVPSASVSIATANDHVCQVMAGASLNVYIRRIRVYQTVAATTAAFVQFELYRLTTAGTGGTAITPAPMDTADAASGATAMTLPTAKGTESTRVGNGAMVVDQTVPTAGLASPPLFEWLFDLPRSKSLRIAAGTTNGVALKVVTATAGASVRFEFDIMEANF